MTQIASGFNLLLDSICDTDLHSNLVHWLATYLRVRQAWVTSQGVSFPWRNVKTGVPQGSVLGPILFNFSRSAVEVTDLEAGLQADLDAVVQWAESKMLSIAPEKCYITLFTPDNRKLIQRSMLTIPQFPSTRRGASLESALTLTSTSVRM